MYGIVVFCIRLFILFRIDVISKQIDNIIDTSFIMQTEEKDAASQIQLPPVLEDRFDCIEQQVRDITAITVNKIT